MSPLSEPLTAVTSPWVEEPALADPDWLVTAARAGRSPVWDEIFALLRPDLMRFVRSRGVSDPDDVLQDVMAAAVRQIGEIEGGWSGLRAWVFTVASRRCADFHRLRRSRPEVPSESVPEPHWPGSAADEPFWEESAFQEASAALSILTEREREVVTLRVVDELDAATVASTLGVSPVNVRVIQSRALAKLRRYLDNNGGCLDKRFRLFPFPVVAGLRCRLGELFPWRISGGRPPRPRRLISHHPIVSASVADTGYRSLAGASQSAAVVLLAAAVGASSLGLIPGPPPAPATVSAAASATAPTSWPAPSPSNSPARGLVSVPPPQEGLHGQVATPAIHHSRAGAVVTTVTAPPTTSLSGPDDEPAPSPASVGSASVVANVTGVMSGVDEVASAAAEVVDGVSKGVSDVVDDVTESVDDATGVTVGETSATVDVVTDVVEHTVDETTGAAEDSVDDATDAAQDVTEEVVDLVTGPFGG